MTTERDIQVAEQLGTLHSEMAAIKLAIIAVQKEVRDHVDREEIRLLAIEKSLSLARFFVLGVKAVVLTLVFVLTLKLGDVKGLWTWLKTL